MLRNIYRGSTSLSFKKLSGFVVPLIVAVSIFGLGLSGCSESGGGGGSDSNSGDLVVGLTDAASDFIKYEVEITSLTLTKQNGAVVEALPVVTTVDFAQYVEMTEFLTAATIPVGRYVKATLHLDYSSANIQIEDAGGNAVVINNNKIQDEDGTDISSLSVSVQLEGRNALTIVPGIPAHLTLDFDLGASNQVDLSGPTLTVKPTLIADVNPQNSKIHRLRGPLKTVDAAAGTFRLVIRPFIHVLSGADERFGTLKVVTNASTYYDINGDQYQGNAGLGALDQQQILTAVIVIGDLNITTREFEATQVYAGSSVPGGDLDVVTGNVVSRSGNQLTVKGATLIRAGGNVVFNDQVTIQVGSNTTVNRQHSKDPYTIEDISVGQRITVFGELNGDDTELDATAGHVGLLLTTVKGTVVDASGSTVIVDLTGIDGRKIDLFTFTGTGTGTDADPENYKVDAGSLDILGLETADVVKLRGFVTAFGRADGEADFEARTLVNVSNVKGLMIANWNPATLDAILFEANFDITLDLSEVGLFHHLNRAGVVTDLTELAVAPTIEPQASDRGLFQIVQAGSRLLFFTYTDFVDELAERLTTSDVTHITATGIFDDTNFKLTSDFIVVGLVEGGGGQGSAVALDTVD